MRNEAFTGWLARAIRRPGVWLLIVLFVLITFFQYAEYIQHPSFLAHLTENLGLTRYTVERILYLLPIIWAGALFGWKGGAVISLAAVVSMLPRAILTSPSHEDALIEIALVFIIGILFSYSLESLQKERARRAQVESAQRELKVHLQLIKQNEKRLAALNQTSSIISQSLELTDVLENAVDCVRDVIGVEAVLIYILNKEDNSLSLAAHRGISEEFAEGVARIRVGEGFNGKVAETGEPLVIPDASVDDRQTRLMVEREGIRSQLIVPLISKGMVAGTLCAAMKHHRTFLQDEISLLTSIGNQIGVSVENARLYQKERQIAEQLRVSEQRYRELFENAHDAIWLHDLEGNIIASNKACVRLTGYELKELLDLKAGRLLDSESIEVSRNVQERLLKGDNAGSFSEIKLIKKDGTIAFVQLASSLVLGNGTPTAVQHIARDITETRYMQESLRFLLQQITRAEEEERKRIARELHDETIQALVAHCQRIDDLASSTKNVGKEVRQRLEELHQQANSIMQEIRRLSQDLRPAALDNLGLVPALEWLASQIIKYSGLEINVKVVGEKRKLPDEAELVIFRTAQEALRNVWKHAQATSVDLILEFDQDKIKVISNDNGRGFEPPQKLSSLLRYGKLGLAGIQERFRLLGGDLIVSSKPGEGTTITAELPL